MEKLKKYNQRILAIFGTLLVLFLAGTIIVVGVYFIGDLIRKFQYNRQNQDVSLNIRPVETTANNDDTTKIIIKQDVSFQEPQLIDSLQKIYLIPISQVNLEKPEEIRAKSARSFFSRKSSKKYNYYSFTGTFNNILVSNHTQKTKKFIFNKKININNFQNILVGNKHLILINATTIDSNKDKRLSTEDLNNLYIYDIETQKLTEFSFENLSFYDYYTVFEGNEIFIRFGLDKNEDGEYAYWNEPLTMKIYNSEKNSLKDLVDKNKIEELQKIINE